MSRLIQSDWSIVTIQQDETGRVVASSLDLAESDRGFSVHGSLVGEITQTGRSLIGEDARNDLRQNKPPEEYLCYVEIPLRTAQNEIIGTICSFVQEPRQFSTSIKVASIDRGSDQSANLF